MVTNYPDSLHKSGTPNFLRGYDNSGNPSEIDPNTISGGLIDVQSFTTSGTWTKPTGTNSIEIIVIGGGGGGFSNAVNGGNGGTSSFGIHSSATGGLGGNIKKWRCWRNRHWWRF